MIFVLLPGLDGTGSLFEWFVRRLGSRPPSPERTVCHRRGILLRPRCDPVGGATGGKPASCRPGIVVRLSTVRNLRRVACAVSLSRPVPSPSTALDSPFSPYRPKRLQRCPVAPGPGHCHRESPGASQPRARCAHGGCQSAACRKPGPHSGPARRRRPPARQPHSVPDRGGGDSRSAPAVAVRSRGVRGRVMDLPFPAPADSPLTPRV